MEFPEFEKLALHHTLVPVSLRVPGDLTTPLLAYLNIRKRNSTSFLLESVEDIGRSARYSFIGFNPSEIVSNSGIRLKIKKEGSEESIKKDIFDHLKEKIKSVTYPRLAELPFFTGGIVGYIGFENVALIEDTIKFNNLDTPIAPDSILGFYKTVIVFDHFKHQIIIVVNADVNEKSDLKIKYDKAKAELKSVKQLLSVSPDYKSDFKIISYKPDPDGDQNFIDSVIASKKNITQGDVFQIVLSKKFQADYQGDPFNIYRALRMINPSPYMYFMEFENDFKVIGTSPEDLLKVKNGKAEILPIAGTRRRGKTEEDDSALEDELMNDPKEIAEHVMLVDLARNDLGRVCKYGTVRMAEEMKINRFSHVMHIVSRVEGRLNNGIDCIDALKASFPAGTVTGAPKIRAIQLLNKYEKLSRNVYAGGAGYIDFNGNLDMCIAIRTLFAANGKLIWQAGAGIVADSIPENELLEIKNKSAAMLSAIKCAEVIDENLDY